MTTRRVELKDFASVLKEFSDLHIQQIKQGVTSGIARSVPMLVERSPVDTGLYAQSWKFTATEESAILGNTAPHAAIIEYGTRKFKPPIGPLLEWAKRVTGDPSQPPHYSNHVWALALYTQKRIQDRGILPKNILRDALPDIVENIKHELEQMK